MSQSWSVVYASRCIYLLACRKIIWTTQIIFDFHVFLTASSTPSLREKKIWQNAQTLWPHIYTTNVEIRRLWHDIPRCFVHFLEKQIFLLKHRKCKVCLPFQLLEIETGRHSNCFSYSTSGRASDRLVGVSQTLWNINIQTWLLDYFIKQKINYISLQINI